MVVSDLKISKIFFSFAGSIAPKQVSHTARSLHKKVDHCVENGQSPCWLNAGNLISLHTDPRAILALNKLELSLGTNVSQKWCGV